MRPAERDILLLILAAAAGSADGWSYFGLGHAFVANMTGNTVLLGTAMFLERDLLRPFIALVSYALGAGLAAFLTRRVRQGSIWPRAVSWTLLLESAILMGAAAAWAFVGREGAKPGSTPDLNALLACVGFAVGMQSGAMLQLKVPGVVTTYITGTWTNLMSGLVHFATFGRKRPEGQKVEREERLLIQGGVLVAYFLSAIATGLLFREARLAVGALPAASVLAAGAYGMARGSDETAQKRSPKTGAA